MPNSNECSPYFCVFETEISYASHRCCFSLCQIFVHLIDTISNMIVRLIEEIASAPVEGELPCLACRSASTNRFFLILLNSSRAAFTSLRAFRVSLSVSASLVSTSSSLQDNMKIHSSNRSKIAHRAIAFMFGAICSISLMIFSMPASSSAPCAADPS